MKIYITEDKPVRKIKEGCLGGSAVEHLPSAQGVIPSPGIKSWIRFSAGNLLLLLLMSLPLSLSVSLISK